MRLIGVLVLAAAALAVSVWLLADDPLGRGLFVTAFATLGAALVIALHKANIKRLLTGQEARLGQRAGPRRSGR